MGDEAREGLLASHGPAGTNRRRGTRRDGDCLVQTCGGISQHSQHSCRLRWQLCRVIACDDASRTSSAKPSAPPPPSSLPSVALRRLLRKIRTVPCSFLCSARHASISWRYLSCFLSAPAIPRCSAARSVCNCARSDSSSACRRALSARCPCSSARHAVSCSLCCSTTRAISSRFARKASCNCARSASSRCARMARSFCTSCVKSRRCSSKASVARSPSCL